jgi:hypothetical protein
MKGKLLYFLSILLLGTIIFLYIRNQQEQQIDLESNTKNASSLNVESSAPSPVNTEKRVSLNKFTIEELEGDYWNHPYIKLNNEMSDVSLILEYNDQDQLEVRFLYYESVPVEEDEEEWGVQREGPTTTLTPLSDTVFIIDRPSDLFDSDFLYIIKTANQIGLSLDGKEIAYYKHQYIMPELSDEALINHFYGSAKEEGLRVNVGRIERFTELETDYALVFFEESYNELDGFKVGGNNNYLSVAKFKIEPSGMHLITFLRTCPCGHYEDGYSSNDIMIYPTFQKIGHKHFLLRKIPKREGRLNKTIFQVYDVDKFEEVLSIDLETYTPNAQGGKKYIQKKSFSFTEDDCAIIIQQDPLVEEQTNFKLKQDIYLFEDENNAFLKVD